MGHALEFSPSPAPWAFEIPLDLSGWKWEPPTSAAERTQKDPSVVNSLAERFRNLWGTATPSINVEEEVVLDYVPPANAQSVDEVHIDVRVESLRQSAQLLNARQFRRRFAYICDRLQQSMILGEVTPDRLPLISAELWDLLDNKFPEGSGNQDVHNAMLLSQCSAIVAGATLSRVFLRALVPVSFWNALLTKISTLPVNDAYYVLFTQIMDMTPADRHGELSKGILATLHNFFRAWGTLQEDFDAPKSFVHTVSKALASIAPTEHAQLFEDARTLLDHTRAQLCASETFQQEVSITRRRNLRLNWLRFLAHLPKVKEDFLMDECDRLWNNIPADGSLASAELCSLLLIQWSNEDNLHDPVMVSTKYKILKEIHGRKTAFGCLALAVYEGTPREHRLSQLERMWKLVSRLNMSKRVIGDLKAISKSTHLPRVLLEMLADISEDHRFAIAMHDLHESLRKSEKMWQFNPTIFAKYAEQIIRDPSMPEDSLWKALDIHFSQKRGKSVGKMNATHLGIWGQKRAAILEQAVKVFSEARHLTPRQAFRRVSICVRFLEEAGGGPVSPDVLTVLYKEISRELRAGQPGISQRLRWFLSVVERNYGKEKAWECHRALTEWQDEMIPFFPLTRPKE